MAPRSLQEAGLRLDLVVQLLLKTLHFVGELSGVEMADRLGVTFPVIEPAIEPLKSQHLVEIVGGTQLGAPSYRYRITQLGRERAAVFLSNNMYTGAAPVPLDQYLAYMKAFAASVPRDASRADVRRAFKHLVLSDRVLDQVGPAVNAGHSLFVYGPPGNGKTVVSQAIGNLLKGELWVPQALEIDGSIVQVFDPVNHEPLPQPPAKATLDDANRPDRRWVPCKRPLITVGGELMLEALELGYNETSGFYRAPLQLIANGGVLVIDDFGRQRCSPHALLNRWILPLESRVDYMTLRNGQKVEVPFMVLPVFATNIKPVELVDEAFLRRIHYKVFAESPTPGQFLEIFANCIAERNLETEPGLAETLLTEIYPARKIQIRGCQPRDLIEQSLSIAKYLGEPPRLTRRLMEAACDAYFVDAEQGVEAVRSTTPAAW
jgi:predicted ATPase with chaperone activity